LGTSNFGVEHLCDDCSDSNCGLKFEMVGKNSRMREQIEENRVAAFLEGLILLLDNDERRSMLDIWSLRVFSRTLRLDGMDMHLYALGNS
jgi:hypothetical protein